MACQKSYLRGYEDASRVVTELLNKSENSYVQLYGESVLTFVLRDLQLRVTQNTKKVLDLSKV